MEKIMNEENELRKYKQNWWKDQLREIVGKRS